MKVLLIERCNYCKYFKFKLGVYRDDIKTISLSRFKCYNPETARKNSNYRIINRKLALGGKFPSWCNLEDYPG